MLNHLRCLLLNMPPGPQNEPFGEIIPADFTPTPLPAHLAAVRAILLGTAPDRDYANYRLAQYLTLLNATELASYVTALDPRVSDGPPDASMFRGAFVPSAAQLDAGDRRGIQLLGVAGADDYRGVSSYSWRIDLTGDTTAILTQSAPTPASTTVTFDRNGAWSAPLDLFSVGVKASVETGSDASWLVTAKARPGLGLPAIVTRLRREGGDHLAQTLEGPEPYSSFRALWRRHPNLPYRLCGAVLALAYKINDLREGV